MTLPAGVTLGAGKRVPVSQRGYFCFIHNEWHYTACMFAGEAQLNIREGFDVPLGRTAPPPGEPDNWVHQLQLAGDPTPLTGSTMRQSQVALRKLLPTSTIKFGTMSDAEILTELGNGASIRMSFDCSKLPRPLKRRVGYGYMGRHAMVVDDVRGTAADTEGSLTDHMWKPAKAIRAIWVKWSDIAPAIVRAPNGEAYVAIAYESAAYTTEPDPLPPPVETDAAKVARLEQELATARSTIATLETSVTDLAAAKTRAEARASVLSSASGYLVGDVEAALVKFKERIA